MTKEEATACYMQINKWRQQLVHQSFTGDGLQPWQETQLRAYRDEMDRLEPLVYPEMHEALEQWEKRINVQEAFADVLEASARYWKAVAAGEAPDPDDAAVVNQLDRQIEEQESERPE